MHSDPHPGNILVRAHPKHPSKPQVVLIDHGLYVEMSEEFRHQYCLLWRSLFVGDVKSIEDIAVSWGIRRQNSDIFASLTLLRPHRLRKKPSTEEQTPEERKSAAIARQEQQAGLKDRIKTMLESEELIPRPLIFITRAMRMMQGNNQAVGSPSNRINILAHWAADGLALSTPQHSQSLRALGLRAYTVEKLRLVIFRVVLVFVDVGFVLTRVRAWVQERMGKTGERMEDLLEKQVTVRRSFSLYSSPSPSPPRPQPLPLPLSRSPSLSPRPRALTLRLRSTLLTHCTCRRWRGKSSASSSTTRPSPVEPLPPPSPSFTRLSLLSPLCTAIPL